MGRYKIIKNMFNRKYTASNQGMILVSVIVIVSILMFVGLALLSATTDQYIYASNYTYTTNAIYTAEAGIEQSIQQLNSNNSFSGYSTAQVFFNNKNQGYGTFVTSVTTSGNNVKIITSTGNVYRFGSTSNPISSKIVRVTVVGTASPGYSVVTGTGGLILGGGATITNSQVLVNGTINLSGNSQIGTYDQPLTVNAANDACPTGSNPGPTYPSVCSNSQPISMSSNSHIYGSVCATGQTSSGPNNNIQGGNGGQGLIVGCTTSPSAMPSYNRNAQIAAVTTTASGSNSSYICQHDNNQASWPANLELTGNVIIGGDCKINITGNTYITGNLSIEGSAKMQVANSLGTTRPVVLVDGTITVNGSAKLTANDSGTGIEFISFDSNASCGSSCTNLSGTALADTTTFPTINITSKAKLAGMVFYAYWGQLNLKGSGNLGTAMGQTVNLSGDGTITFGTALASGTETWTVSSYQQKYP